MGQNKGLHITVDALSHPSVEGDGLLPIDGLTESLQRLIKNVADVYQLNQDFVGASLLTVASAAMGNKFKLETEFTDVPMLWTILVGYSGLGKSEPISAMAQPLIEEQKERLEGYRSAMKAWRQAKDENAPKPIFHQCYLNNCTPEAAFKALADNPNGLMQYSDEILTFIGTFGKYNNGGTADESTYLSIWSHKPLTITRKTEDPIMVQSPFLSLIGGIPDELLGEIFTKRRSVSGFAQRLLFVFPSVIKKKHYTSTKVQKPDMTEWHSLIKRLMGASETTYTLTPEAYEKYNEYRNSLSEKMDAQPNAIKSLYAKLMIYAARFAIVAHVLGDDAASSQVTERDMAYSIRCMRYFEDCWVRVFKYVGAGCKQPPSVSETIAYMWQYGKKRNPNLTEQQLADVFGGSRQQVHNAISAMSANP